VSGRPAGQRASPAARARADVVHSLDTVAQFVTRRTGAADRRRVVLCYHSVHPSAPFASASPAVFADHLDWLTDNCDVVPLTDLRDAAADPQRPRVAITFDDGYLDNFVHAYPLLATRGLSATFFLTAGLVERDPAVIAGMAKLWGCAIDDVEPLGWEQAREMAASGMDFGSHTWSHGNLALMHPARATCELRIAKDSLEQRLGRTIDSLAYPFGRVHVHVTEDTIASARAAGHTLGVVTLPRAVRRSDDALRLPRLVVGDDDVTALARKVLGAIDWHATIHERTPTRPRAASTSEIAVPVATAASSSLVEDPRPLVSVIVTTFNYAHFLPTAIESVLEQTYSDTDVLVVDDGSTDDTAAVVERYATRNVRYVYQENAGAGAARNTGLSLTNGSLVAFLDADDVWLPDKLTRQIDHLHRHPELALVGCHAYGCETDLSVIDIVWGGDFEAGHAFEQLLLRNFVLNPTCVLARRSAFEAVGGFSEVSMWEDWDTWLQISRRFAIGFTAEPLVKVRRHERGLSPRSAYERVAQDDAILQRHLRYVSNWKRPVVRRRARSVAYLHAARSAFVAGDRDIARRLSTRALLNDPTMLTRQKLGVFLRAHGRVQGSAIGGAAAVTAGHPW
jgi:glycosyltransferase involved in cell wall biosynthesis/peptidoglycan/xylan/chitin deacetylase (PgdA/CDA1 family)